MKLPIYIISDNHFLLEDSKKERYRREKLFDLFEKIKTTGGTLIIGGDFFDFWFDYGSYHHQEYNKLIAELSQLNEKGVKIHYVLGKTKVKNSTLKQKKLFQAEINFFQKDQRCFFPIIGQVTIRNHRELKFGI